MGVHLHLDIVSGVHVVPDRLFELIGCFAQFSLIFFWNGDLVQRRREHPHDAFRSELQPFFLARKHFRDFAELLFGQRRGLFDTLRSSKAALTYSIQHGMRELARRIKKF